MDNYYIGNYAEDSSREFPVHKGWIVGKFMEETPRKNDHVEIKYWEFPAGETGHKAKKSRIIECVFILEGHCTAMIDGRHYELHAGEYVVIKPGVASNAVEYAHALTRGLTIKAPSDPEAKTLLEDS